LAQANQELQDEIAERKRVERHLGYKPEKLIGKYMHELNLLTANSVEAAFSDTLRVLSGERIDSTVYEFIAKDGTRKLSEVSGALLFREGKVVALVSVARDITDRRRAEEEALRRTTQLEALRQVGLELTAQLDSDHLLRSIASRAVELFQSTSGGIYLYRPDRDVLEWVMPVGPCQPPVGVVLRKGEGLSGKVWETGAPLIVDDYRRWEGQATIYASYPWTAVVGVPIRWGDEFLGVLVVNTLDQHSFSRADAELLGLFATQAAIAIRNARLFAALAEERARLELLYRSSQHLSTSLDVHDVAQRALDDICAVVGAVQGAVFVAEPASDGGVDRLRLVSSAGYDIESIDAMDSRPVPRVGSGLIGWVAAQKQSVLVDDVREDSRWVTAQGVDEGGHGRLYP
jgi:PAS domain S-box-containing protein